MRLLLDTHTLVWLLVDEGRLPKDLVQQVLSPRNEVFASAVSAYEIALKFKRGHWQEVAPLASAFEDICANSGFEILSVTARHALAAGGLPLDHRDPFDRILAAQAVLDDMPILSGDRALDYFPVRRIWN